MSIKLKIKNLEIGKKQLQSKDQYVILNVDLINIETKFDFEKRLVLFSCERSVIFMLLQ